MPMSTSPSSYRYQIGSACGPRPGSSTASTPTCAASRNATRSAIVIMPASVMVVASVVFERYGETVHGNHGPAFDELGLGLGQRNCVVRALVDGPRGQPDENSDDRDQHDPRGDQRCQMKAADEALVRGVDDLRSNVRGDRVGRVVDDTDRPADRVACRGDERGGNLAGEPRRESGTVVRRQDGSENRDSDRAADLTSGVVHRGADTRLLTRQ